MMLAREVQMKTKVRMNGRIEALSQIAIHMITNKSNTEISLYRKHLIIPKPPFDSAASKATIIDLNKSVADLFKYASQSKGIEVIPSLKTHKSCRCHARVLSTINEI